MGTYGEGFVACRVSLRVDAAGVDMGRVSVRIRMGNEWGVAGTTNRKEVGA
jgi:hypothetical protein